MPSARHTDSLKGRSNLAAVKLHNGTRHLSSRSTVSVLGASALCILLVEDEPLILEIMAESLREAGFEVIEANDGVQAVRLLAASPTRFTMLVTDFHMPGGVDGAQVALKGQQESPGLPVIIATGRPDVMQQSWRDELGYLVLRKPYLASELIGLVRRLASKRDPTGIPRD